MNQIANQIIEIETTEIHSTHNEGKSVVGGKFIRTLKKKIYKYMAPVSKNVYIDQLDDIVNKYNNSYKHTYIESSKDINNKDPKFKIGDIVRISKYKNIFAKSYTLN